MADRRIRHFRSIAYGIIDALGTFGGVFEILFWSLMFLFGSFRESVYLFSVINCLIEINRNEEARPKTEIRNKENMISKNKLSNHDRFNRLLNKRSQALTDMRNAK